MKILFVHQNFPGQFPHLAPALAKRGHEVLALTDEKNERTGPVKTVRYKAPEPVQTNGVLGRSYSNHAERGLLAARGARALRDRHGFTPDLIIGHTGWGETLFLREIWPDARLLVYAELMYRTRGHDVGFDPEIHPDSDEGRFMTVARSAHLIQGIVQADAAIAPTVYQADSFPPELRGKITVIHDGIDTSRVKPDPNAWLELPGGQRLDAGDEVISFVSRSLEPYRGFHIFMRALPQVLAARPEAQVVLVGGDGASYGGLPRNAKSWKDVMLAELGDRLDLDRVHFVGRLRYPDYLALIQLAGPLLSDLSVRSVLVTDRGVGGRRLCGGVRHGTGAGTDQGRPERKAGAILRRAGVVGRADPGIAGRPPGRTPAAGRPPDHS